MKNLPKNKKILIGVGVIVLLIVILLASGILKFKVTRTGEGPEQVSEPTRRIGQKEELMSKETTFKSAGGKVTMSIKLPVGWAVGSLEGIDFAAGSQFPDKFADGTPFRANLIAGVNRQSPKVTSFADFETSLKNEFFRNNPSLEEVSSYSTNIDGVDVYISEFRNTRPDGLVVHQIQHFYYLNNNYFATVTGSVAEETWDKYSQVVNDSLKTVKLVEVME